MLVNTILEYLENNKRTIFLLVGGVTLLTLIVCGVILLIFTGNKAKPIEKKVTEEKKLIYVDFMIEEESENPLEPSYALFREPKNKWTQNDIERYWIPTQPILSEQGNLKKEF